VEFLLTALKKFGKGYFKFLAVNNGTVFERSSVEVAPIVLYFKDEADAREFYSFISRNPTWVSLGHRLGFRLPRDHASHLTKGAWTTTDDATDPNLDNIASYAVDTAENRAAAAQKGGQLSSSRLVANVARDIMGGKTAAAVAGLLETSPIAVDDLRGEHRGTAVLANLKQAVDDPQFAEELKLQLADLPRGAWSPAHQQTLFDALQTVGFDNAGAQNIIAAISPTDTRIIVVDQQLNDDLTTHQKKAVEYVREEARRLQVGRATPLRIIMPLNQTECDAMVQSLRKEFPAVSVESSLSMKKSTIKLLQSMTNMNWNSTLVVCPAAMVAGLQTTLGAKVISHEELLPVVQFLDIGRLAERLRAILIAA